MGNPGLSTDPLSYLEYVKIARKIQFYHGGNEQAKMQGRCRGQRKSKNRSFLACFKKKKTCRKKTSLYRPGKHRVLQFYFPTPTGSWVVFVFVFDWKLGLGLCCNLLCHSTVRVCQRFKWQTFFLSHAILYFENIEE